MELLYLKIILLVVMMLIALFYGLLPIKIYDFVKRKQRNGKSSLASLFLSLLSCLSGGVFLGVCFLDLLPFANETFEKVKEDTGINSDYPFPELIAGAGFFLVYFVEELSMKLCSGQENGKETDPSFCDDCSQYREIEVRAEFTNPAYTVAGQVENNPHAQSVSSKKFRAASFLSNRIRTSSVLYNAKENITETHSSADGTVRTMTFIAALTFHSTLEGFAFGVQNTPISVATLFFGIIVHKAVVAFSIGMRLARCHPGRRCFIICLIAFVALTAPLGGTVGILVQNSKLNETPKNIVSTILTCIALGTFLYITFFEILFTEQTSRAPKLLQFFSTLTGFALIALLMIFGD